ERGVAASGLEDGAVGSGDGGSEAGVQGRAGVGPGHLARQRFHGQSARHLAGGVPAHPVGNAEQSPLGVEEVGVLVVGTAQARVGRRSRFESHGRKPRRALRRWQGAASRRRRGGHTDCRRAWGMRHGTWARFFVAGLLVLAAAACRRDLAEERASAPAPPPAAQIAPVTESMTLEERLERLSQELSAAYQGRLEGEALGRLLRAEAITDRLLEVKAPFPWLARGYSVDARLRQLQALADRIVAELRRGTEPEELLDEVQALMQATEDLRVALREGGGDRPTPLDALLATTLPDTTGVFVSEGATGE